jgi:hypothetical protein
MERQREQLRAARYEWTHRRQPRMGLEPHRLIFIYGTAVITKMTRLRGQSLRGARLEAYVPFGHWRPQTFIAELRVDELATPWALDRPMNCLAFKVYIKIQLAPCLQPREVMITDDF